MIAQHLVMFKMVDHAISGSCYWPMALMLLFLWRRQVFGIAQRLQYKISLSEFSRIIIDMTVLLDI